MKAVEIKKLAVNKGWQIVEREGLFGVSTKTGLWHWFHDRIAGHLLFNYTIDRNTGKVYKGFYQETKVTDMLRNELVLMYNPQFA